MTISSPTVRTDALGSGSTATYPYTFKVNDEDHLRVIVRLISTGEETVLALGTDYTVTGVGDAAGGDIVLVDNNQAWLDGSGFLLATYAITVRFYGPYTQPTDIRNQGDFFPETHENAFDYLTRLIQQTADGQARSLRLPESETPTDDATILPAAEVRANMALGFDADGNPVAISEIPVGSASVFVQTLLDDANAGAFLTTLGVSSFVQTLLNDANAGAFLTTLGVSAFIQTLLDDADAATTWATLKLAVETSPGSIGSSQDDYAGLNGGYLVTLGRLTASGAVNITGFAGGTAAKRMILVNIGANTITLKHQDAASSAANRMILAGAVDQAMAQDAVVFLVYDATTARWRQTNGNLAAASTIAGDVTGTLAASTVVKIRGVSVHTVAPNDKETLIYDAGNTRLAFARPPGRWELVETLTLSGQTSVTSAVLPTTADMFLLELQNARSQGGDLLMRVDNAGGGVIDTGANYNYVARTLASFADNAGETSWQLATDWVSGWVTILRETSTPSIRTQIMAQLMPGVYSEEVLYAGEHHDGSAADITKIQVLSSSGVMDGKAFLWKYVRQ